MTNPVNDALTQIVRALRSERISFALVGGLAVSVRARPRTTKDVDVAVSIASERDLETLIFNLGTRGYRVHQSLEHAPTGRLATVRMLSPAHVLVDVSGFELRDRARGRGQRDRSRFRIAGADSCRDG